MRRFGGKVSFRNFFVPKFQPRAGLTIAFNVRKEIPSEMVNFTPENLIISTAHACHFSSFVYIQQSRIYTMITLDEINFWDFVEKAGVLIATKRRQLIETLLEILL